MSIHNELRKIERAAWALWKSTDGEGPRVSEATQELAIRLYELAGYWNWSLWNAMRAHYLKALQEPRHGGSRLHVQQARQFARDVLYILHAQRAKDSWEPRVLLALAENPNLTLAEAAKVGKVNKATISRHPVLGLRWARKDKDGRPIPRPKRMPKLYDHDGAS